MLTQRQISPFAERIVSLLPPLWEQSGEEHLMKQVILTVFTRLINAMKVESRQYHSMVLPLIQRAVEPGSVRPHSHPTRQLVKGSVLSIVVCAI